MHSRMRGRSSSYALVLLAALILFAHAASVYADNPSQGANNAPADAQKSKESTKSSKDTVTSGSDGKSESKSEGCTASAIKEAQARDDGEFLQKCGSTKGKVTAKDKDGKVTFECIKGEDCDAKLREMQEVMKSGGSVTYQPPGSNDGVQLRTQPNPQRTDQFNAILDSYDPKNQARNAEIAAQNRADDNAFANGGKGFLDSDGFANLLEKEAVKNFPKTNYPIVEGTLSDWGSLRSRLDNVALSDTTWDMANSFGNLSRFVEGQGGFINLGGGSTFSFQNGVPTFNLSPSDIRPFSQSGAFGATAALGSSNPFLQNPYASLQPPQSPTFQSLAGLQQAAPQGTTVGEIVAIRPDGTQQTLVWNPFTGGFEPLVDASQLPPAIDPKLISFTSVSDVTAAQIEQAFAELDSGQKTFQELADVAAFPIAPSEPTSVPGTVLTNLTPEERAAVLPTFGQAVSAWSEGKIDNVEFARQIGQNLAQSSRAIFQRFGFAQVLPEGNVVDPPLAENGVPVIPVERSPIAPVGSVGVVLENGAIVSFDPNTIGRLEDGRGVRFGDLVQVASDGSTTVDLQTLRSTAEAVGVDLDSFPLKSEKTLETANVFTESRGAYTGAEETKPFEGTVGGVLASAEKDPDQYDSRVNGEGLNGREYVYGQKDPETAKKEEQEQAAAEQAQPPSAWERVKMAASCLVRQCSPEEAAFVARGTPLPSEPRGTLELPSASFFASETSISPEERARMQAEANRTGRTVYWQDGDIAVAFVPKAPTAAAEAPTAEGTGVTQEVVTQPKAAADGPAMPNESQSPPPLAATIQELWKDIANTEPPKAVLPAVHGTVIDGENAGQIPSLGKQVADAAKTALSDLNKLNPFAISDAHAAQGAKTRFGIKALDAAPDNWVSKNLRDILAPQGCSARDHSCYTSPTADAEAYFSKLIGQPEYKDGCQPLTVRCIVVGKWVSDDSAWRAKVGARAVQINPEGHANDVARSMREQGVDVTVDTVLDLGDQSTRLALAKAMSKREGAEPYADNILEEGYKRAVARFGGVMPAPTLSGGENDILYRSLSGRELAAAERNGIDAVAQRLRDMGYNVEVVERKGVYKATRPGEERPAPLIGIVTHSTGDKDNSAELYVREPQNRGLFRTAYQGGIDCDETSCKITLARSEDKYPTATRDNHVSFTSSRRPDAPNPDLNNWDTIGVALPGAAGRELMDSEKKASADLARELSREFGITRVTAHGVEDYKDLPGQEGVAMRDAMRAAIAGDGGDTRAPAVARLPGAAPASSGGVGASGRAGSDRPVLYDVASYNWDKFTDVFQDPAKAARLAFGFDGKEPVPGDETVAVTYPHWGNEGGQSSGVVTNEILSRLPKGTEISIPHTASFSEAQRVLDNCKGCVVKFYMESNPNERNDAGYGMSIPARIEQATQLAQRLEQAGYGERVVRTIEPDAARDYFDAGRSAVAVEHAKLIKAAGFEYEAKSLSAAQIEQLQREAGVTVRTAVFEDPKNPAYARSLEESIASGRPTTVILKGVPTPGYPNPDTRGEALALAERHKDAGNLTVVYTPAGGVPELVRIADESVPRGLLDRGIMKEGVSFDRAQTSAQAAERARYFLESGGLLWDSARKTVEAGYESLSEATDGVRETFGFGDRTSGGNQVTLMDTPLGRDVEVDTRGGVQASSRYVDAATAQLQDQVQRSVESGALPSGTEIVSREEALRRAAELPNENKSLTSFGSTGKTTGQLAADTINATNAERFIATPDGKFYAVGQETAKIELPTKEGIQAVADRMKEVFACSNRSCLGMVSYAGNGAALPEDVKSIMQNKFGFGGATNPNGNIAKVTIAAFAGACEMDPADCQGVYINSAQRNRSGLGSDRHTSEYARAFDLQGFRDNNQKVRFLTRMAAIGEAMGRDLKANVGQGGNVTHIDFNGSEISRGGGWVWEYPGGQSSAQAALHSAVASGRLSDSFITNTLGANLSAAAPRATLQPVVGGGEAVALPASSAKGYAEVIALVYGPPTPESMGTAVQGAVPIGRYDPTEPATAVTRFDPNTGRIYTVPIPPAERAPVVPRAPWSPDGGYRGPGGGVTPSPFEQIAQSLGNMFGGGQGGGGQGGGQGGATSGGAPAAGAPSAPRAAPPAVAAATPAILKFSCEPNAFLKEGITTVTWACGNNGTSKGTGFDTRGLPSGSVQVPLATTTTFNLACYAQGALVAERQCTVALLKPKVVIVAIPSSVEKGGTVRIGWITSQTKNCSFYGPGTVLQGGGPHGTMEVKNLEASTRFKLACGTTAGVFETPLIVEVKGYSGPIVDAEVSAEGVPAAPPAKSVEQRESAAVTNESAEPLNQSGGSAAPPNGSQEGKFTATDASGNAISLCDPSVGLFKFTQCLLGN